MGSSGLRRYYKRDRITTVKPTTSTITSTTPSTTATTTTSPVIVSIQNDSVIRDTRSTGIFAGSHIYPAFTDKPATTTTSTTTTSTLKNLNSLTKTSERGAMNDITVDLASSSGDSFNNLNKVESSTYQSVEFIDNDNNKATEYDGASIISSSSTYEPVIEEIIYPSKEQHSILAESSKSEFIVDEGEPITSDTENHNVEYPASIRQLPSPKQIQPFDGTTDLIAQHLSRDNIKDKLQPFHETVIYHNHPRDSPRARSVSYSAVIQNIPDNSNNNNNNNKVWNIGRKSYEELNKYEEPNFTNNNGTADDKDDHQRPQDNIYKQSSPIVYGHPEQNYEVDEAVSVITNGRVHGVQPSQPQITIRKENVDNAETRDEKQTKKNDDNQKVGYVVEGRNYRKYRVEERTSDGFIVGEYGVVSHDDGSLRGVRYTADGTINPRLIYDALMKFLSL